MNMQEYWWSTSLSHYYKKRRFNKIVNLLNIDLEKDLNILDVGSATGKDFIKFLNGRKNLKITGVDIDKYTLEQDNVTQLLCDAQELSFPDKSFDITISIGLLEHIEPIEKISKILSEIDRVSKSYCLIVPCINTIIEPHLKSYRWQMRDRNHKKQINDVGVNYLSDDAWTKFTNLNGAKTERLWYIPFLISNLIIYKRDNN